MINLLSKNDRVASLHEYKKRRSILALWFLVALGLLAVVLFLPISFSVSSQNETLKTSLAGVEHRIATGQAAGVEDIVKHVNTNLSLVQVATTSMAVPLSLVRTALVNDTPASVTLTSIVYDRGADLSSIVSLSLSGVAADREAVLALSDALSKDPLFLSVDSPISNLVKSTSILFTLQAKIGPQKQ
jgi:Tfp pilus assembly protein PilN